MMTVEDTKDVYKGWNLIAELHWNTSTSTFNLNRTYLWGLDLSGSMQGAGGVGGLLAIQEDGETYLPAYDAMGNLHALMTVTAATLNGNSYSAGDIVAAYEYDAFGQTLRESGDYAASNPFRFSTKYTDIDVAQKREDGSIARLTRRAESAGAQKGSTTWQTSLVYYGYRYYSPSLGRFINRDPIEEQGGVNLYSFVGNNSINAWDYLGMITDYSYDNINEWADEGIDGGLALEARSLAQRRRVAGLPDYDPETGTYSASSELLHPDYFGTWAKNNGWRTGDLNDEFEAKVAAIAPHAVHEKRDKKEEAPNSGGTVAAGGSGLGDTLRRIPGIGSVLGAAGDVVAGTIGLAANIVTFGHASRWHYSGIAENSAFWVDKGFSGRTDIRLDEFGPKYRIATDGETGPHRNGPGNENNIKITTHNSGNSWNRYGRYEII